MHSTRLAETWHRLRTWFEPPPQPAAPLGLHHYDRKQTGERSRIHLRVDPDGSALLLVNASRVVHLNPTAAFMAYWILEGRPAATAIQAITRHYQVSQVQAASDFALVLEQVNELVRPDGACPIHLLDLEVTAPFSARPAAPYRMDLALTYRCNNDCAHCYNARERTFPELSTAAWLQVIDKVWQVGIPHLVLTGGEPSLRQDLPTLIAHAESLGMITGMNTNARRLSDRRFLDQLIEAGLDHIQVTLESHLAPIHDQMVGSTGAWKQTVSGLKNILETHLYVMTNTTLLRENSAHLAGTLDFLAELGVPTLGLNALIYAGHGRTVGTGLAEKELPPLLDLARQHTAHTGQRLIWYTPTQYCHFDPMQLELGVKSCTAALYNMCVEPDGAVLPCQSYYQPLGNILGDSWESIWNHPLALRLRERQYTPAKCQGCALLAECGGGCPLQLDQETESSPHSKRDERRA